MANDYGIRISKPRYSADSAGDTDLMFNSGWPSLPIAEEINLTNVTGSRSFSHSLTFAPFFQVWRTRNGATKRYGLNSAGSGLGHPVRIGASGGIITEDFNDPGAADYHIKLYNINLAVDKEYEFIKPPVSPGVYDPDYGLKVVKEGRDIDSEDLRDFIIHTRAQSPQVLSIKTQSDSSNSINFTDPQSYRAWVFGFVREATTGYYRFVPYFAQAYPRVAFSQSGGRYTYSIAYSPLAGDDSATLVVLRDPMFAANDVTVQY